MEKVIEINEIEVVKKKRGRKPKNSSIEENCQIVEKKKRGRKKKYEIENFDKIINRNEINNFNHNIVYSDDEEVPVNQENIKSISFGNLNITVSKKPILENNFTYKNLLSTQTINEEELESDEEKEIPIENIIKVNLDLKNSINEDRFYKETKKYVTDFTEHVKDQSLKRMRVVTCLKNVVTDNEWPSECGICCWWCCNTFDCIPCTLPTKYDPLRKRFTFFGIFCSWNCSKAYNLNMSDHKKSERNGLITLWNRNCNKN